MATLPVSGAAFDLRDPDGVDIENKKK